MIVFVRTLSRRRAARRDVETLNALLTFSAVGLLVSLLLLLDGIDIGTGLF